MRETAGTSLRGSNISRIVVYWVGHASGRFTGGANDRELKLVLRLPGEHRQGVGEAGAIPTGALFAQAVEDALAGSGLEICEIPLSPNRLFELMSATGG